MSRALCLTLALLVLPLTSARADAPPDLAANAALKYWQAFAQLPKLTDADAQKLNAEYLTMPLDADARELVTKSEYALRMMYQGAALPRCEWGMGWEEEGIEALLPQMSAARLLSTLACLRARLRFEQGQSAAALDDLVAALTMGRQVSLDGSLIGVLVGYSIEARMNEALAAYLPKLNPGMIKDLKKRRDALPQGSRPATALLKCEKETMTWLIRKIKEAKDKEGLVTFLGALLGKPQDSPEKRREAGLAFLQECGGTADGMVKFAEETRASYERMAPKLDLPLDQFAKQWDAEKVKQAGNPVFKMLFSDVSVGRSAQARADVRRALMAAALAVQLDGRDALKNHPDPVVGGSFEYVAFEGGFELRSKFKQSDDKLVTLTVGRRGK